MPNAGFPFSIKCVNRMTTTKVANRTIPNGAVRLKSMRIPETNIGDGHDRPNKTG